MDYSIKKWKKKMCYTVAYRKMVGMLNGKIGSLDFYSIKSYRKKFDYQRLLLKADHMKS